MVRYSTCYVILWLLLQRTVVCSSALSRICWLARLKTYANDSTHYDGTDNDRIAASQNTLDSVIDSIILSTLLLLQSVANA